MSGKAKGAVRRCQLTVPNFVSVDIAETVLYAENNPARKNLCRTQWKAIKHKKTTS
jgi:hypothetical protein